MVKALIDTHGAARHPGRPTPADACVAQHRRHPADTVFGLWRTRAPDGLAYQEALRAEW
ncbi:hypothetical protein [Burkholderia sp. IMCC1007]|uniref:hypothetical protein n=1 Tax=Burkholderia sp. IMCC1007 TaxID=3004104 RepID=UPI0022B3C282|nr:hypothetical protein [Burkholderia sp. IMCC1007]